MIIRVWLKGKDYPEIYPDAISGYEKGFLYYINLGSVLIKYPIKNIEYIIEDYKK